MLHHQASKNGRSIPSCGAGRGSLSKLLRRRRWPAASPRGGFRSPTATPAWKPASSVCACSEQHFPWRARKSSATQFRSEEHTSELQSLMRISDAVFCLIKKNKYNKRTDIHSTKSTINKLNTSTT